MSVLLKVKKKTNKIDLTKIVFYFEISAEFNFQNVIKKCLVPEEMTTWIPRFMICNLFIQDTNS